jgi:hypothetical protein
MAPLQPLWHCARPALAQAYLAQLGGGVITSTSIFAPRRTGKTVFLLKDLSPAAEAAGIRVAYVDLWQARSAPALAIVRGLEEALKPRNLRERAGAKLQEPVKKLKMKGGLGELKGEAEVEFADEKTAATEAGLRIDELMGKLSTKYPVLLLVDEAQELARNEANEDVAKSLRTALTKYRERVRVVYTGSSRSRLAHMFSDPEAPLYAPGLGVVEFPLLGRDLAEFAAKKFAEATGGTRALNVDGATRVLEELQHRPEPFLQAVMLMLASPGVTLEAAAQQMLLRSAEQDNYRGTWTALTPLQRELLRLCLDPHFKPFTQATRVALAKALGQPAIAISSMQSAFKALDDKNLLSKSPRGPYEFDDHLFRQWVERHVAAPTLPVREMPVRDLPVRKLSARKLFD